MATGRRSKAPQNSFEQKRKGISIVNTRKANIVHLDTKRSATYVHVESELTSSHEIGNPYSTEPQATEPDYYSKKKLRQERAVTHVESHLSVLEASSISCVKMEPLCLNESSYKFVEPLPDKYLCGICKSVLNEPHVTECCGQHFCKNCLEKSKSENAYGSFNRRMAKICPHCRQDNFNHIRYLPFKREIDSLKVYCSRKSSGCNVQPDYADKNTHEETCKYVNVYCTNGCGEILFRKDLESHTENYCDLRECTCELCGEVGEYKEIESSEHHSICPDVIIKCTNSCGEQFKRKDSESHNSICPEAMVACDFSEAGCQATPKRKDLDSHMDTNMKQHLCQLMKAHGAMKLEFKAFKEKHEVESAECMYEEACAS